MSQEDVYSFHAPFLADTAPEYGPSGCRMYAYTYLYAPRAVDITLGLFWGEHWLNGKFLASGQPSRRSTCRIDRTVRLNAGWNRLFVECRVWDARWDFYLAVPRDAGIVVSAYRDPVRGVFFRHTRPVTREEFVAAVKPVGIPFADDATFGEGTFWFDATDLRGAGKPGREVDLLVRESSQMHESS
jgi:hypothetical protein